MKMVQIPEGLFVELMKYHVLGIEDSLPKIKSGLEEKYEAMMKRELYTKSKTAKTQEEREEARQAYLDKVGMHRDFRW
ncbi:MAG: complexin-2 [Lachnospiraceae bacterium]|nr:complexin-2 [Lachnospiraceae bacterium]